MDALRQLTNFIARRFHLRDSDPSRSLDPSVNPGITHQEEREQELSEQVGFARNYYLETWKHKAKHVKWDCNIDCRFNNQNWTFEAAFANYDPAAYDKSDLGPEEVVDDGQVHQSQAWQLARETCPVKPPSPMKEKMHYLMAHVTSPRRRRASSGSSSVRSSLQPGERGSPPS